MQYILNDEEIRVALAEAIEKKSDFIENVNPENCWFECKAGEIEGSSVGDIHDVRFIYDTDNN